MDYKIKAWSDLNFFCQEVVTPQKITFYGSKYQACKGITLKNSPTGKAFITASVRQTVTTRTQLRVSLGN